MNLSFIYLLSNYILKNKRWLRPCSGPAFVRCAINFTNFLLFTVISASLPFFIVTLAVYIFIRDLRNLHGKCFIAYVSSLSIMYSTLIFNGLGLQEFHINHNIVCKTIGYTFLTSVLCCFFWLNVMCYDIYRTFKYIIYGNDMNSSIFNNLF